METTWWELLTPRGLRTLSASHLLYRGRHGGPPADRDRMLSHQGTVWPWLLGPFVTAYVKAFGSTEESEKNRAVSSAPGSPFVRGGRRAGVGILRRGRPPRSPGGSRPRPGAWAKSSACSGKRESPFDFGTGGRRCFSVRGPACRPSPGAVRFPLVSVGAQDGAGSVRTLPLQQSRDRTPTADKGGKVEKIFLGDGLVRVDPRPPGRGV